MIGLKVDVSDLRHLTRGLDKLAVDNEKLMRRSNIDALRRAQTVAKREVIRFGRFNKHKQAKGDIHSGTRIRPDGGLGGTLSMRTPRYSLAAWAKDADPKGDFRGRGVQTQQGAFSLNIFERRAAFVRNMNGNTLVAGSEGDTRKITRTYYSVPPSALLGYAEVNEPTSQRYFSAYDGAYRQKLDRAWSRL